MKMVSGGLRDEAVSCIPIQEKSQVLGYELQLRAPRDLGEGTGEGGCALSRFSV